MEANYVHKDSTTLLQDKLVKNELNQIELQYKALKQQKFNELLKENQELKLELSGYRQAILNNKEMLGLKEDNDKLKKQLEDANEQISYIRRSIERKEERIIDLQYERIPYTNEYVDKLLNQQKEFISYLENEKDRLSRECSQIYEDSLGKTRSVNEDIFNEVNDILQKYKSIIGVLDEKSNNIPS